jgi:two-component system NtrC family response regulator
MAEGRKISPADLEINGNHNGNGNGHLTLKEAREQIERALIVETLALYKDNITKTSEKLGISRPTLYELIDKLGIARK